MADNHQSPASWDPQRSLYLAAAIAGLGVILKLLARLPSWLRSLLLLEGLALTPLVSVALAYLVKLAYDRHFEQEQAEYNARRLERLAKLRQIHLDFGRRSDLHVDSASPHTRYTYSATFRHALLQFISHVKSDFVLPWYSRISPSSSFPDALERSILHCVDAATRRLSHVNAVELCASRILPKMTRHFDEYRKLEHLLHSTEKSSTSTAYPVNLSSRHRSAPPLAANTAAILQSHHKHLHPALPATALANPMPSVEAYLRLRVVEPLLKVLLPEEDAQSPAVLAMAREIITCSILMPVVDMMTEPDFWNQLIDDKLDPYLQERKQVSQLRRAIETASMVNPEDLKTLDPTSPERLSPNEPSARNDPLKTPVKSRSNTISVRTDSKSFDVFLSSIPKVQSLTEAKRLRNEIDREMRTLKNSALLSGRTVADEQRRREEAHLKRLERARKRIDKRIEKLQGKSPGQGDQPEEMSSPTYEPTLREIIDDPWSLDLFTEFMSHRPESSLLQFWLAVKSLQTPLDDAGATSTDTMCIINSDVAYDSLSLLWTRFLDPKRGPDVLGIKAEAVVKIGDMVSKDRMKVTRQDVVQAQQAAFKAQRDVYEAMLEESFPAFQRTDLYRHVASELQRHTNALLEQRNRQSFDGAGGLILNPSPSSPIQSTQPQKWLSLSSHFPSFSKTKTSNEDQDLARETLAAEDPQVTPKRPTAFRGRARRISNVFNNMRPSANDSSTVNPALGFLIGSPQDEADGIRRGIFDEDTHESAGHPERETEEVQRDADADAYVELQRMEAIQVALTSIMEKDARSRNVKGKADHRYSVNFLTPRQSMSSLFSESIHDRQPIFDPLGARHSFDNDSFLHRPQLTRNNPGRKKSTVGISPDYRRRDRVFDDEDEDDDEESVADSVEIPASPTPSSRKLSSVFDVQNASRQFELGNTEVGAEIDWMNNRLAHLREQDTMLDKMIRAADLKGSVGQHRLLVTSQSDLRLEIQALSLQKQQYEQLQQNSVIHPERTKLQIPTATVLAEEAGKQIVRYLVNVEQQGDPGSAPTQWTVPRRFNEFYNLHQTLKSDPRLAEAFRKKNIDIPAKKLIPKLSEAFVEARRLALERYLLNLLQVPLARESIPFRRFLSQSMALPNKKSRNFRKNAAPSPSKAAGDAPSFYQAFTSSIDDILTKPTMLNTLSENLGKQAGSVVGKWDASVVQAGQLGLDWGTNILSPMVNPLIGGFGDPAYPFGSVDGKNGGGDSLGHGGGDSLGVSRQTTFVGQLSDLLMQLLDYKDSDWLRKPALRVILQHFMGNTIERKIREGCESAVSAEACEGYLAMIQDIMWPGGVRRSPSHPRTDDEKNRTKHSAASKIQAIIPDIAANMIGRSSLRRAVRRMFGILQIKILNLHLLLSIIDEFTDAILKGSTKDAAQR